MSPQEQFLADFSRFRRAKQPLFNALGYLGSYQNLHRILAGEIAITHQMAVRLNELCGSSHYLWLRIQQNHDLWLSERALSRDLAKPRSLDGEII